VLWIVSAIIGILGFKTTAKMIKQKVTIVNDAGLHARPAAALVKLASKYESDFYMHMYGYKVNGKSILGVMTLAAEKGAEIEIELDGSDEKEALEAITELIDSGFGEVYEEDE
jgi:phosphocarrier protein